MMNLNTDFAIIKNFTIKDENTGEVDDACKDDSRNCADNVETKDYFARYQDGSGSVNLFKDFVEVYYRMLNKGYTESDIIRAPMPEKEPCNSSSISEFMTSAFAVSLMFCLF